MSYKTTCPKCNGKNLYVTEHNNVKYCFNCSYVEKESTGEQTLERSEHIDVFRNMYTELAQYYHSCLDTDHIKYLHNRGITDATIEKIKIGFCPDSHHILYTHPLAIEAGLAYKGKAFLANRIIFPYWYEDKVTDIRGRTLLNDAEKYKSLFHTSYYRGADYAFNIDSAPTNTILLTEGEIKTIIADQELPSDISVKGLPGMLANRKISLYPFKRVILCFDNQRNNRRQLLLAIQKWIKRIPEAYIATLPLRGKDKQDIDGYIQAYGIGAFQLVLNNALPYHTWKGYVHI